MRRAAALFEGFAQGWNPWKERGSEEEKEEVWEERFGVREGRMVR